MHRIIEMNGRLASDRRAPIFDSLRTGAIVIYRNLPEIHSLGDAICAQAARTYDARCAEGVIGLFRTGEVRDVETLSSIYRAFRPLRDGRYLTCLFSDFVEGLDLPRPLLVDPGYCRMMVPDLFAEAYSHPELFDPDEFEPHHPNEFEHTVHDGKLRDNAHRDVDVRHSHFQVNFWFPLHDLDETRTLLLFPDAYHLDISQYGQLRDQDKPSEWGFGQVAQIPLKFGDVIVFHSQQLHASPSQARMRTRFTVEMRVASGCTDDNARVYRRIFWGLDNFLPADARTDAATRAEQLAEPPSKRLDIDHVVAGQTAHTVVHRLFRSADASRKAGYARRPDTVFDDAFLLDAADWSRVLKRLDELPCDEDLLLLVARLLLRQGYQMLGVALLRRICNRTSSYFWALEVGYFAVMNKENQLAEIAFERAGNLAAVSSVKLDQYAPAMPPPRSPGLLQLLPDVAVKISQAFTWRIKTGDFVDAAAFDHRDYWDNPPSRPTERSAAATGSLPRSSSRIVPTLVKSHGRYNIIRCGLDFVAVEQGLGEVRLYEEILGEREIGSSILRSTSVDALTSKIDAAALAAPDTTKSIRLSSQIVPTLVKSYRGYNIVRCGSNLVAVQQGLGETRLYEETLGERELGSSILRSTSIDELTNKIDAVANPPPEPPTAESRPMPQQSAPAEARPSKAHMDEDFLQYAFHDDTAAIAVALKNSLDSAPQSLQLIGSSALVDELCRALEASGHRVTRIRWSFADPIPAGGLGTGILCDIPKTFDEWRACAAVIADGSVQPIWHRILSWSVLRQMLAKYEYNVESLEELIKVYRGRATEAIGRRSNAQIDRIEQFFPLRGKRVIEFGPSDGNRTADLIASGVSSVLAVEGRPENVIKLLVAKHAMGWQNLDIAFDNFQLPGSWARSRYDFVYAQGVYYHCQNPLIFIDLLTQLSDVIFIGGWAASDEKPPTPWLELEHDGATYRGKVYTESYHFLSGLATQSYMLKSTEIERFLSARGFVTRYCDVTVLQDNLGTDWIELLAVRA
jgi:hypothetical protein